MCRIGLICVINSYNVTHFASSTVADFYHGIGVQTKFIYVVHPRENRQAKSANKVIFNGIKKKLDDT